MYSVLCPVGFQLSFDKTFLLIHQCNISVAHFCENTLQYGICSYTLVFRDVLLITISSFRITYLLLVLREKNTIIIVIVINLHIIVTLLR